MDAAFIDVVAVARKSIAEQVGGAQDAEGVPLLVGGRSSGARVACRTALAVGAKGVLALAFPLQPPRPAGRSAPSRLPELIGAGVPVLVVQGERDVFGSAATLSEALADVLPAAVPARSSGSEGLVLSTAPGADHSLRKGIDAAAVTAWLQRFLR